MPHSLSNNSTVTRSRPSSTSTNPANAFPRQAGATLLVPESAGDPLSPARSTFSFETSPKSVQEAERDVQLDDGRGQQPGQNPSARQYFKEQFAYRDEPSSARERVTKDAPIIAELRTNVIIKDEYTLVTDLSHHLSQRYQRPESSIMITVNHSACLLLGGSFEPTYILTISALPVQLQPATNKRNAALTQKFMHESIGVAPERGIMKFVPIQEECLAVNGSTMLGEIERLERQQAEENGAKRLASKSSKKSAVAKAKSSMQLSRGSSRAQETSTPPLTEPTPFDSGVAVNEKADDQLAPLETMESSMNRKARNPRNVLSDKMGTKQSMPNLAPPPISEDRSPSLRIGKRKSFMTMFKR